MHFIRVLRNLWSTASSVLTTVSATELATGVVTVLPATAVITASFTSQAHAMAVCSSPAADPDGDGWGWENNDSCIVDSSAGSNSSPSVASVTANGDPVCSAAVLDLSLIHI